MAEAVDPQPLPWGRHRNGQVTVGLLFALGVPVGSALAEYEGQPLLNLISLATAATAFGLVAWGLRLGPTTDDRRVARHGVAARAVVEDAVASNITDSTSDGPTVARVVQIDLRVEVEGEPDVRVRLRRWVHVDRIHQLQPGFVLDAKILPGRPQDPALGLRGPAPPG